MLILERFEDRFAIIENGDKRLEVDISSVAPEVKEATIRRRKEIIKLQNGLWS